MAEDLSDIKKQCIFCNIIEGKVQSRKVHSDDLCTAILDINPANPGHILLMPSEHYPILPLVPDKVVARLFVVAKQLSQNLLKGLKAQGTTLFLANGIPAGQKAQHFMLHIIPRMPDDGIQMALPQRQLSDKEMAQIQQVIRGQLNQMLGIQEPKAQPAPEPEKPKSEKASEQARPTSQPAEPKKPTESRSVELDFDALKRFLR